MCERGPTCKRIGLGAFVEYSSGIDAFIGVRSELRSRSRPPKKADSREVLSEKNRRDRRKTLFESRRETFNIPRQIILSIIAGNPMVDLNTGRV